MHSGNKWRSAVWLNAMHCGKKVVNSRIRTPFYIFFSNPVYVAARSAAIIYRLLLFLCWPVSLGEHRTDMFLRITVQHRTIKLYSNTVPKLAIIVLSLTHFPILSPALITCLIPFQDLGKIQKITQIWA